MSRSLLSSTPGFEPSGRLTSRFRSTLSGASRPSRERPTAPNAAMPPPSCPLSTGTPSIFRGATMLSVGRAGPRNSVAIRSRRSVASTSGTSVGFGGLALGRVGNRAIGAAAPSSVNSTEKAGTSHASSVPASCTSDGLVSRTSCGSEARVENIMAAFRAHLGWRCFVTENLPVLYQSPGCWPQNHSN